MDLALLRRFVAYELVQHHNAAFRSLTARGLVELGRGIDNWVAVDMFGHTFSGPAWREKQVPDALVLSWTG